MTATSVIFDPLLPWPVIVGLGVAAIVMVAMAVAGRLPGWWLRLAAAAVLVLAVANPSVQNEEREPLSDIVLAVVDDTSSQKIGDRPDQSEAALARLRERVAARPDTELRVLRLGDAEDNRGTELMSRLAQAMAEEPRSRIAAAVLITDGQVHDIDRAPGMPAPLHLLLTGHADDWDRRLVVTTAPAFAILDEPVTLGLRVEDQGQAPTRPGQRVRLEIDIDGARDRALEVPVGQDVVLPLTLRHGGVNVIQITTPTAEGELTDRNNSAVVQINGVRDRLRVLLVSGEPHPGERTWRNLLKSDSSVDLVHFTILRPPEKQDGVPVAELSLIAFPTRELFLDKIDEFDLIIFDRYRRRGILPSVYLDNVALYVENGGAALVAGGPEFASADSLYRSPLGAIIPAEPTGIVVDKAFRPAISSLGARHPVTEGLEAYAPRAEGGEPGWGSWLRLVEVIPNSGEILMNGPDDRPLLMLDRVGDGRVALLASDHAWLWSRGYEGGGPQLELLRRLAHWLMKEPELEEEALTATAEGQTLFVTRRTLGEGARDVEITGPDGSVVTLPMTEASPGRFTAEYAAPEIGLYRLRQGDLETVMALGPSAPREFEETVATGDKLTDVVGRTRGGIMPLEAGFPDIRSVRPGRQAAGRGWIALTPRNAYQTADIKVIPFLPAWLMLALAALLTVGAWLREGRR